LLKKPVSSRGIRGRTPYSRGRERRKKKKDLSHFRPKKNSLLLSFGEKKRVRADQGPGRRGKGRGGRGSVLAAKHPFSSSEKGKVTCRVQREFVVRQEKKKKMISSIREGKIPFGLDKKLRPSRWEQDRNHLLGGEGEEKGERKGRAGHGSTARLLSPKKKAKRDPPRKEEEKYTPGRRRKKSPTTQVTKKGDAAPVRHVVLPG